MQGVVGLNPPKGGYIFTMSSRTLEPPNPEGYLASVAGEIKGGLGEVLDTLTYLSTVRVMNVA